MATTPPRFASRDLMRMPPLYPLALAGLAVLTLVLALLPLTRAFAEVQVNYNEGWNLLWQQRAAQGLTLYSGHRETLLCNYPPLSLIACLPALMGAPRAGLYGLEALGGGLSRSERAFAADAEFLRSRPGPALCESMLLCLRGGKVTSIDPFNTYQATRTGQLPADTLIAQISAHRFATIQIRSPRGAEGDRFRNFGLDAHDTIARDYRPVRKSLMGTFSVPAD